MSGVSLRRARAALLLATAMLVSGCVGLPDSGPVRSEPAGALVEEEAPVDFTPFGPQQGAAPVEIVRGFLVAMQATPLNTSVARRFLATGSRSSWVPERGTVVYADETRTAVGKDVRLDLASTIELDSRGTWLGERGDTGYRLRVVRERGQWRISNPPNRLIVPAAHFESRFNQYFLYFFDKSAEVLVPEPVYVPAGAQAPTLLVDGLLQGPARRLLGVERTFIPARTALDDISVPVSQDGTAEVPLSDEVLDLDDEQLGLVFAQLAWTLGQVPGVERLRVTVDGSPLDLPGEGTDVDVTGWSGLDPAVAWASQSIFGVRDGRAVTLVGGEERRVSGVFGTLDLDVREIASDLAGEQIAATTGSGSVLVAPRSSEAGTVPKRTDARKVYSSGEDLLKPTWDMHGLLWVLDRAGGTAELTVLRRGADEEVEVAGVTGEDVRALVVSRDGTRLAAVVSAGGRERLLLARVQRGRDGAVRRVLPAEPVPLLHLGVRTIVDVAWRSPASLALLTAPTPDTSQVVVVKVDGSSTVAEATTDAEIFRGEADRLVTAPVLGSGLYIRTSEGAMFALASNGRWVGAGLEPGLRSPTFVG